MPSDDRARSALNAMGVRAQAFRAAIAITGNEIRGHLAPLREAEREKPGAAATLGAFAAGRIDTDRFARLLAPAKSTPPGNRVALARALDVLDELERQGDELFRVRVERGADLVEEVDRALANAGRAFGAARLANRIRSGQFESGGPDGEGALERFPFRFWSKAERNLAPPIVIEAAGADTVVAGLAAYLDGNQAFALLVEGPASPAPLARLISPGVLVLQTDDAEAVRHLAEQAGPAAAAVMPAGSARFLHTPGAAAGPGHIEVNHLPAQEPRRPVGSISVFQQQQELRLLAVLAGAVKEHDAPAAHEDASKATEVVAQATGLGNGTSPVAAATPVDPVGALAAWLLARVDLSDLEAGGS